jgi:hypothetical protein
VLSPSVGLLYIFKERPKGLTLAFSLLEFDRHDACDNIIAMLQYLSR